MINRSPNHEYYRPLRNKENWNNTFSTNDHQNPSDVLARYQQTIIDLRREIKDKIGKEEFFTALSTKISLSDISKLSLDTCLGEATRLRTAEKERIKALQDEVERNKKELTNQIQQLRQEIRSNSKEEIEAKQTNTLRIVRQSQHSILDRLQKKAERSEMDKIMHLSSLLAIQFELIKKRFGNFEVDYNLIWKEISNLYAYQQNIKTALQTERESQQHREGNKEAVINQKQLQKTSQKISGISSLFRSLCVSPRKHENAIQDNQYRQAEGEQQLIEKGLKTLKERMQGIRMGQINTQCSIASFSQRLKAIEGNYESCSNCLLQMQQQLKSSLFEVRLQVDSLQTKTDNLKQTATRSIQQKFDIDLGELNKNIKAEIVQACQQITHKVMSLYSECARHSDIELLRSSIDSLDRSLQQKINAVVQASKKSNEHFSSKMELQQDKIRIVHKQLSCRVRLQDHDRDLQTLMTSQNALTLMKKTQTNLKQQINRFVTEQQTINQIICAETVLARWLWTSGELRSGNLISWDKEIINTLPQNFKYSNNEYCFKVASSGIYRIQMGFYSKKKPTVQIIVNGHTVVSAVNSNAYVLHHSSGKLKDVSNAQVTGLTYYDFLMLPQSSRIAIGYQGDQGHGFLSIQRL